MTAGTGGGDAARGASNLSVLIVEDEALQRDLLKRMIGRLGGVEVTTATDGKDAVAQMSAGNKPDLMITDLQMPEMDGVELLRHIGEMAHRPCVVLISAVNPAILDAARRVASANRLDVLGALEKPVKKEAVSGFLEQTRERLNAIEAPKKPRPAGPRMTREEFVAALDERRVKAFLQPKLSLADDVVIGAEALARLMSESGSIVSPAAFIPMVEADAELSRELTFAMLRQVLEAFSGPLGDALPKAISINLPALCLGEPNLVGALSEIMAGSGVGHDRIVLEVTETAAIENFAIALEVLTRLRMAGFGLSIDDYGTGHSSLERLTSIPFTEVKIDRSFVHGCVENQAVNAVLSSTIDLSRNLGLHSVAEGAETMDEVAVLKQLQCDVVQGYAIARPMPLDEYCDWVKAR